VGEPRVLGFEAYCALAATLHSRTSAERAQILSAAGLDEAAWERSEDHWSEQIVADMAAGDDRRSAAFDAARSAELANRWPTETISVATPSPLRVLPFIPSAPGVGARPRSFDDDESTTLGASGRIVDEPTQITNDTTDAPLPFAMDEPPAPLTLEQYASFRAELGVFPERRAALYARYHIPDDKTRRDLDEYYRRRFAHDKAAQKQWLALSTRFRDWLQATKR
jgi:hypothetical protein